jgi:predicted nucleic acid-binding protein
MDVRVVDASALAALLFGEPDGPAIAGQVRGAWIVAPTLLGFELANVCLKKIRRHPTERDGLLAGFALLGEMEIATIAVDHALVLALAERTGLSAYDASYLWLARETGGQLVTLDRRLAAAAAS